MKSIKILQTTWLFIMLSTSLLAQEDVNQENDHTLNSNLYVEAAMTFSHFEQQVKQEIGGTKGELLVDDTNLSFGLSGGYHLTSYISLGAYIRYDNGTRSSGNFGGFDSEGATIVTNQIGGDYSEFWAGPFVRLHYRKLFFGLGYGLIGSRLDEGRDDVPSASGGAGTFSLDPSVALLINIGGSADITDQLGLYFGIEYRARYYDGRGDVSLIDDIALGTQNITPLIGIKYRLLAKN